MENEGETEARTTAWSATPDSLPSTGEVQVGRWRPQAKVQIEVSEYWFTVNFPRPGSRESKGRQERCQSYLPRKYPVSTPQVVAMLIAASDEEMSREQLQAATGLKDREHFRKAYLTMYSWAPGCWK